MEDNMLNLLREAVRKSAKFLARDFYEMETAKAGAASRHDFASKSLNKVGRELSINLSKYFNVAFDKTEIYQAEGSKLTVLVDLGDGFENFKRGMPYFSLMFTIYKMQNGERFPLAFLIDFPVIGEVYYAQRGKGAWFERLKSNIPTSMRLRASSNADIGNVGILCDSENYLKALEITREVRVLGSIGLCFAYVALGKFDAAICNNRNLLVDGADILLQESGGVIIANGENTSDRQKTGRCINLSQSDQILIVSNAIEKKLTPLIG